MLFAVLSLIGCGASSSPDVADESALATLVAVRKGTPTPLVERIEVAVPFVYIDAERRFLRFAATIQNPTDATIQGMSARWDALDTRGELVGSLERQLPPIPPHSTFYYLGGAGSRGLEGVPSRVNVVITDPGNPSAVAPTYFVADSVEMDPEPHSLVDRPSYVVSGNLTTGPMPVERSRITVYALLRNAEGAIVGADFTTPALIPDVLEPHTRFQVQLRDVAVTEPPISADLIAYPEPQP
jgi:hypothetical protein